MGGRPQQGRPAAEAAGGGAQTAGGGAEGTRDWAGGAGAQHHDPPADHEAAHTPEAQGQVQQEPPQTAQAAGREGDQHAFRWVQTIDSTIDDI